MKNLILFIFYCFLGTTAFGQNVVRRVNESTNEFINRIKPEDYKELAHQIIETNGWNSTSKAIIIFFGYYDPRDRNIGFNEIIGYLYLPVGNNTYRNIQFGPFEEDGGYPEIASVFFVNADKDKAKELAIICIREHRHYDYSGTEYEIHIYDNPNATNKLKLLDISSHFNGSEFGYREGESTTTKFKTAKDVKLELKRMGF